ncbi:hypothetical protein SLOPH_2732 [Spraguea lophii 42_110]|uniref:Uncharacterized protein n=1 Tax=Spraguea lophii (strain 42_110) TaxID=1358809 RepID=S7XFN1_SPRLO|nr:hypothetical protein SLOPH_2732 [Spraguea lophii 42_110]
MSNKEKKSKIEIIEDPRFHAKCNYTKHYKDYGFLYPKEVTQKLKERFIRRSKEDKKVKKGKKRFYVKKKPIVKE